MQRKPLIRLTSSALLRRFATFSPKGRRTHSKRRTPQGAHLRCLGAIPDSRDRRGYAFPDGGGLFEGRPRVKL